MLWSFWLRKDVFNANIMYGCKHRLIIGQHNFIYCGLFPKCMKALLIGVLFAILIIIGGTVTLMVIDSSRTIQANVVTNGVSHIDNSPALPVKKQAAADEGIQIAAESDSTTGISAKEQLQAFQAQEKINTAAVSSEKTGFTLNYSMKHSGCAAMIELKQDAVEDAESDYDYAKKAYTKATDELDDLEDSDEIEEAQEEVNEKKKELDNAEKSLFAAREDLIKARTTCVI